VIFVWCDVGFEVCVVVCIEVIDCIYVCLFEMVHVVMYIMG